ncbi:type III-B CRISPR module RAMP protein Cmr1 [Caminibacter pacificus]
MEKISVEFETITPIFTGDAWRECTELKPSSIMGSLRFWFEVYCHFAGIVVKEKEELKDKEYQKILKDLKKDIDRRVDVKDLDKYVFDKLPLTLPSKIFGCTGWKSRIEIESIRYLDDYCFGNRLNLPNKICIKKREDASGNCPSKSNGYWSVWHLPQPYFFGKFEVVFKTTEEIRDNILLPLLNFIQNYGFLGAKNNIGYGRVRVLAPDLSSYSIIKISKFIDKENITLEIFQKTLLAFPLKTNDKLMLPDKIYYCETNLKDENLIEIIKKLLIHKSSLRRHLKKEKKYTSTERHFIFGFVSKKHNEATKIIPLITKNGKVYEGNLLSIMGIKNFGDKK